VAEQKREIKLPNKNLAIDFYVGLFAILGVVAFGYLSINIAGIQLFKHDSYPITAEFDNISGLKTGAAVEIAGVQIGEVAKIDLSTTNALITMQIRKAVKLRDDDIAAIRTKGIIGERYVKIIPGGSDASLPVGGSILDTESAVDMEEMLGKIIHRME